MRPFPKISSWLWWIFAALWFAGWHILLTQHTWTDPAHRVPGRIGDNTVMLWNLGWVRYALQHGSPGFWFTNAYYPDGFFFLYGTPTWLDGFLCWLASPALPRGYTGAILWANISMLIATTASGLLMISSLRAWKITAWPVLLLTSSAVTFSWFRMFAMSGHYHFFATQWMLASLCAISWAAHAGAAGNHRLWLRRCAAAGLLLGIAYLNDQTMTIFAAILAALILASAGLMRPRAKIRSILTGAALCYGCSLLIASVHLVPTIILLFRGKINYWIDKSPRLVDATSLVLPPSWSFLGGMVQPWRERHGLIWAEGTYLGIVQVILLAVCTLAALIFLARRRIEGPRAAIFWTTTAAWAFIICALGDRLVIGQHQMVTFPGRLLKDLPILNNIRLPQRWIWPAHLCIALAAATLLQQWLSSKWRQQNWINAALAACCLIPPLEAITWPSVPPLDYKTDDYLRPPVVEVARREYTTGPVLMMPAYKAFGHANVFQFLWGYDVPMIMTYTARMPIKPEDLPWHGDQWTPATGEWLRARNVQTIIFPFNDGSIDRSRDWIANAKAAVPTLKIYDRRGQRL